MIKSVKVRLNLNNKQLTKLFQYAECAIFAYNWAIVRERENYNQGNKFISDNDLRKEFTQLKKLPEYEWLNSISNDVTKQAIKKVGGFSMSHKRNKQKLNWIKLCEKGRIPNNCKYLNPRFTYDGLYWYVSVGIEIEDVKETPTGNGVGIDLGVKDLAVCSDGNTYENINKTAKVKKLEKRKRRLQRSLSRRYEKNREGKSYYKTCNIIKREKGLLKVNRRLTNIRHNHTHQVTSKIVKRKPSFISLEDLNVRDMMKNKHLSKAIQQQRFYEFRQQVKYKSDWNNISLILVDKFYPSSKTCSCCGCVKEDLKLSDRIFICPDCGNKIDRDYNASLNLKNYGENVLNQSVA